MVYKRPESVLVVIYSEQHNVLLLQRKDDPSFWQSVTGSMEDGETPLMTAIRELDEEVDIDLSTTPYRIVDCHTINQFPIRPKWRFRYPPNTQCITEYVFCVEIQQSQALSLTEHLTYDWVTQQEAVDRVWSPSNRRAIAAFVPGPKA